ncbi:GNAT family N-acetyltransferase [Robertmurraya mangrovi]
MEFIIGNKVKLRKIKEDDLKILWQLIYGVVNPEWKKWDAPYFPLNHIDYETFYKREIKEINGEEVRWMAIDVDGEIIGTVSFYWEHQPSNWLEAGIVIYNPKYWNGGYGTEALKLWVDTIFKTKDVPRVGITTWSGNDRMMKVAEKLGLQLEGRMRKCRQYNGEYYDSIRMGILREEWEEIYT